MTWTYSNAPSSSLRDRVRFLVGDTDTNNQLVTDEEIAWTLSDAGDNAYSAAATVCRVIAAEDRGADSVTVGDVSESGRSVETWMDLAASLERRAVAVGSCPSPFLGGSSIDRRASNATDTDRTPPRFRTGQFDNPPATAPSTST